MTANQFQSPAIYLAAFVFLFFLTACGSSKATGPVPGGPIAGGGNPGTVQATPGAPTSPFEGTWTTTCISDSDRAGNAGVAETRSVAITGDKLVYTIVNFSETDCRQESRLDSDQEEDWKVRFTSDPQTAAPFYTYKVEYLDPTTGQTTYTLHVGKDAGSTYIQFDSDVQQYFKS